VVAGRTYRIRVEFTNAETGHKTAAGTVTGRPSLMLAALRVGGNYQLPDVEEAIAKAGKMAQECDAVICVTGGNLDWETEGSDRTQFALPGATDLLVDTLLQANDHTIICNISVSDYLS
jgi:beta-glucosidase